MTLQTITKAREHWICGIYQLMKMYLNYKIECHGKSPRKEFLAALYFMHAFAFAILNLFCNVQLKMQFCKVRSL